MKSNYLGMTCLLVASTLLLIGCSQQPKLSGSVTPNPTETTGGKVTGDNGKALHIVTTFPPLYAHVDNIIDDNDTLTNLVPPGTSVHTWQPKPSDVLAMEEADAIITNGLGLEEFLEDYLEGLEKKGVSIVDTSEGVVYIEFDDHEEDEQHHHHEGPDPHVWLDPSNAEIQVGNIVTVLTKLDPSQEKFYKENAGTYIQSLKILDTDIKQQFLDIEIQPFIVFHDAYQYFLHAYNLENDQVGMIQEFHGDNPSQKQLAKLIETIQHEKVTTIFTEPQFNPSVVQRLKQETGVTAKEIDPIGSTLSKDGYTVMMENLVHAFINE